MAQLDHFAGTRLLMEHLIGLGHREIAHLTHEDFITSRGSGTPHAMRLETIIGWRDLHPPGRHDTAG